jgi:hypothetical protein
MNVDNYKTNKSKLKIKHFLNIQHEVEGYPTNEDFLFELIESLEINNMLLEPFGVIHCRRNLKCSQFINYSYEILHSHLVELESKKIIEKISDSSDNIRTVKFKLILNPWN